MNSEPGARLVRRALLQHLAHVRAVAAVARDDLATRLGVDPELAIAGRLREQLLCLLGRQLVRRHVVRDARTLLASLQIRAVAADPQHDPVCARDLDRVHVARVDRFEMVGDERVQPLRFPVAVVPR